MATVIKVSYRELQNQLEAVVGQLEGGALGIDEAVEAYEQALKIIAQLEKHLQSAENRVQTLAKTYGTEETGA